MDGTVLIQICSRKRTWSTAGPLKPLEPHAVPWVDLWAVRGHVQHYLVRSMGYLVLQAGNLVRQ